MTTTVVRNATLPQVQWLVERARDQGMIVSCYADTSVAGGVRSLWPEQLDREVQVAEAALPDDHRRREFGQNIEVIRATLASPAARGARGMAVFAGVAHDLLRVFTLDSAVTDRLVVDEEAYVVPLLEYLHRHRRYLVVHTDTHRGRLYTAGRGGVHLIESLDENVPKRQRAGVERWGKQQATIARHRENHILHYRKELVREIERAWAEEPYAGLVLLGAHEVLADVRRDLPERLARAVVYEAPQPWVGRRPSIEARVAEATAHAMREHDQRLAVQVRTRLAEHRGIVTGPEEVLNALRSGQLGYAGCVVLEPDGGAVAYRCKGCGWIFAHLHETCPFCEGSCEKTNLWQQIALFAMRHGIAVHFVRPETGLQPHGGVAALVTRETPWAPAAAKAPGAVPAP